MFCFAKFCRLCLKDSSVLINIFCVDKDNEKIMDKMKFLLPELISPLDGFPPWICLSCRTQVNRTFNLFKKWAKTHETLQKYIRKYNVTNQVPNNTIINVQLIGINFKLNNIEKSISTDYKTIIEIEDNCENLNELNQEEHKETHNTDNLDSFKNIDEKNNNENKKLFKEKKSKNDTDNSAIVSEATESLIEYDAQPDVRPVKGDKNSLFDVSETPLNSKTEDINSGHIEVHYNVPSDTRNNSLSLGTDNKVIEELLEIVKITETIQEQQITNKGNTSVSVSDKSVGIDQLIEISVDEHVKSTQSENVINIVKPITQAQLYVLKQSEQQNIGAIQEFSNNVSVSTEEISFKTKNNFKSEENLNFPVSPNNIYLHSLVPPTTQHNILNKAIKIAEITESNENLQPSTQVLKEQTSEMRNNLCYMAETATESFSQTSDNLHYKPYFANYYNSNSNDNNFQQNYIDNNFQYTNDNYSVDFDSVKKISGYLHESYPGSPSNVYCNLDDQTYYHNCDTLMTNILDNTTNNSSVCSSNSDLNNEVLNMRNVIENKYMSTLQTYCTYSNEELNHKSSDVQTLSVNNSWHTVNQDLLTKEKCTLLENVENNFETVVNLESVITKNVRMQNQVPNNYLNCYGNQNNNTNENIFRETNIPYTGNYTVDCSVYNREYTTPQESVNNSIISKQYNSMHYNEIREDYSPTFRKDCFTFSEDSNGNEIPSKKTKITSKRNKTTNNKENKFYQVFQDMEIASRHCNTPIEFTVSLEDIQITYLVDRNKSLYCCRSCNVTYQNISQILDHGISMHNSSQDFTENEYLSTNVTKPDKSVKLIVNHEMRKFICKKCNKNFSEVAALYRHVAVHVSNQRYFCDECGKSFPVYRYLSLHKLIHSRIRVYACKLCPKTFRAKDTLRTHEIVHHEANQNKPFICEICGKGFVIDQYLKIHMKRHNKETGRICHICGKILKNEELCYKHIKEKHLVVNLKECEICHKTFHANRNLKAHMKLHGPRDFKCDQCEKEYFFKRDLDNHQLLHSGFRPHICHYCGKDFRSLGALYKHMRTHTKIKPHVCSICQKAFCQLSSLQAHERVHSGYKPYKCQQCGKGYVQSHVFQQHMKKVHPEEIIC